MTLDWRGLARVCKGVKRPSWMGRFQISRGLEPVICATFIKYLLCTRCYIRHWVINYIKLDRFSWSAGSLEEETLL